MLIVLWLVIALIAIWNSDKRENGKSIAWLCVLFGPIGWVFYGLQWLVDTTQYMDTQPPQDIQADLPKPKRKYKKRKSKIQT